MTTTSTSLLQTALQNLHVSQRNQSRSPRAPSSPGDNEPGSPPSSSDGEEDEEDELVIVGQGTRPATPAPGQKGLVIGQKVPSSLGGKSKDPVRVA